MTCHHLKTFLLVWSHLYQDLNHRLLRNRLLDHQLDLIVKDYHIQITETRIDLQLTSKAHLPLETYQ